MTRKHDKENTFKEDVTKKTTNVFTHRREDEKMKQKKDFVLHS